MAADPPTAPVIPRYAIWPFIIAALILASVVGAFVFRFRHGGVSSDQEDWRLFAEYFGGIAGPPLALIASWLVVVTLRETLREMRGQANLLQRQLRIAQAQDRGATLGVLLGITRGALKHLDYLDPLKAIIKGMEDDALSSTRTTGTPAIDQMLLMTAAYIKTRSKYGEVIVAYVSAVQLSLETLFEQDTGKRITPAAMQESKMPAYLQPALYLGALSENEVRLLTVEAAWRRDESQDDTLGALLSWANLRRPIDSGYLITSDDPADDALDEVYSKLYNDVVKMRERYCQRWVGIASGGAR